MRVMSPERWPFVGRDREIAAAVAALRSRDAVGVSLVGAAGVGTTRLSGAVLARAEAAGSAVRRVVATHAAASLPYGALVDLLPPTPVAVPLDLLRATVERLRAAAGRGGLVLAVDSAHLLDEASATLVNHAARTRAVRVVLTRRAGAPPPDALTGLEADGLCVRLDIEPLPRDDADRLVTAALGGRVDGATLQQLWQLGRGNPRYVAELVSAGVRAGALREEGGLWRVDGTLPVTGHVGELLGARIAVLDADVRAVAELVAVSEPVEGALLERVAGRDVLAAAERRELVVAEEEGRRLVVRLAHPLLGEVLRAGLPRLAARAHRRRLADALAGLGGRRRDDALRVALWRLDAGDSPTPAELISASRTAAGLFDAMLAVRLATAAVDAGGGFDAQLVAADALHTAGRADEAERLLAALAPSDADAAARVAVVRAANLVAGFGRVTDAAALVRAARRDGVAEALDAELAALDGMIALNRGAVADAVAAVGPLLGRPDVPPRAALRGLLVAVPALALAGQAEAAIAVGRQGIAAAPEELPSVAEALRVGLCYATAVAGGLEGAERVAAERYAAAVEQRAPDLHSAWALARGQAALTRGRVATATGWLREAAVLLRDDRSVFGVFTLAWCLGCIAEALALAGDGGAAGGVLEEAYAVTPEPCFIPPRELASVWVEAGATSVGVARERAHEVATEAERLGAATVAVTAWHLAVRLGGAAVAAPRERAVAEGVDGPLSAAHVAFASAVVAGDGAGSRERGRDLRAPRCDARRRRGVGGGSQHLPCGRSAGKRHRPGAALAPPRGWV